MSNDRLRTNSVVLRRYNFEALQPSGLLLTEDAAAARKSHDLATAVLTDPERRKLYDIPPIFTIRGVRNRR